MLADTFPAPRKHLIYRHIFLSLCFIPISILLSRPDVILLARLGSVVWYPATALSLALMLAVSPWYFFLGCISDTFASALFYQQPLWSFSELFSTIGSNACVRPRLACCAASYELISACAASAM